MTHTTEIRPFHPELQEPPQFVAVCSCNWFTSPNSDRQALEAHAKRHTDLYSLPPEARAKVWPHFMTTIRTNSDDSRAFAQCGCGWAGEPRPSVELANKDASTHARLEVEKAMRESRT